MILRHATLADAAAIAALTGELGYTADEAASRERLSKLLDRAECHLVVAEMKGAVAGWLQAVTGEVLESGFRVEIVGLVVGEKFRRRGVGRALVARAEVWARSLGAPAIVVRSNTLRTESHVFYPALGFESTKTQAVYRKHLDSA